MSISESNGALNLVLIYFQGRQNRNTGPSCSKLKMSLVNVSFKLIRLIRYKINTNLFAEKNVNKSYSHVFQQKDL